MRPTLYEASRMLTTAGISANITFDPTRVTPRLRKSIQRQVASGVLTGGYSSHATRVAKYLCKQFSVRYTHTTWYGLLVPSIAVEYRDEFVELLQADLTTYLLDSDTYNPQWEKDRTAENINQIRAGYSVEVRTHSKEYKDKLAALVSQTRTPEDIARATHVAAMLDEERPITILQPYTQE